MLNSDKFAFKKPVEKAKGFKGCSLVNPIT
jgi:hypothetical protein